jgi:anaerobic selenocysteine-containing dehydrogenase
VRLRIEEVRDGVPIARFGIPHAVLGRQEPVVRPALEDVARVHDERAGNARRRRPVVPGRADLQSFDVVVRQQRHEAAVGVSGDTVLVGIARNRRIVGQPQRDLRFAKGLVEEVGGQIERPRVERQQAMTERLHRVEVGEATVAEPRQVHRPLVLAAEQHAADHVGMIRGTVALQEQRLDDVRFLHRVDGGRPRHGRRDRQVSDVVPVEPQRQLVVERQRVEAARLGEDVRDERRRHGMIDDEVEADVLEGVAEGGGGAFRGARRAGEVRAEVQDGNLDRRHRHGHPSLQSSMRSVCPHDCPSACSLDVDVVDGRIASVTGDAAHPFTQGVICGKVRAYAERVHSPLRVLEPLRRVGPKGAGEFAPLGWDAALDEIEQRWRAIIARHGAEAILPFSYAGTMGRIQYYAGHPLFHALGASRLDRTICVGTAYAGWKATLGRVTGNDSEQMVGADLVVLWGINAAYTSVNVMTLVKQAKAAGARVVVVDPYRTATAQVADEHLRVRPGTDLALALAMMHVMVTEGRVDHEYIVRATLGYDRLVEHLKAYPPEWAAPIVGLSAETIAGFARRYAASPATYTRIGIGLSRHDNGGMTCRTLACLPALTGAYAHAHGGALLSSGETAGTDERVLERRDLMPATAPRRINMIHLGRVLTDPALAPPVAALYVYNSNPAAVCPHQTLVRQGLAREDLFTVVHEQVMTDTARYADLVLPATTSMEHLDVYGSYGHHYVQLAAPVLPPPGQARPNWDVFRDLARRFGVARDHYEKDARTLIDEFLATGNDSVRGIDYARLEREGSVRLDLPRPYRPFANGAPTPSGKVEFFSERLQAMQLPPLPTWTPLVEGPEDAARFQRYPLQCIVPPNRFFLNSSFSQSERLRQRQGPPVVFIAPADAVARGIADGHGVRVFNDRGDVRFTARVSDRTQPGVVVVEGLWWHRFHPGGINANALTDDRETDMGGGPALHSNLVEVARS